MINRSHQYSYLLSVVSPSGQFLNLDVVLELTTQGPSFFLFFFFLFLEYLRGEDGSGWNSITRVSI